MGLGLLRPSTTLGKMRRISVIPMIILGEGSKNHQNCRLDLIKRQTKNRAAGSSTGLRGPKR